MTYRADVTALGPRSPHSERVLVRYRDFASLREIEAWADRNRETWRAALDDDEPGFAVNAFVDAGSDLLERRLRLTFNREWGTGQVAREAFR